MAGYVKSSLIQSMKKLNLFDFKNGLNIIRRPMLRMVSSYLRSRSHSCGELGLDDVGKVVVLCGWLQYKRLDQFLLLRDWQGITQVLIPAEKQDMLHPLISNLPLESVIQVQGTVMKRPEDQQNDKMQTGSIEVKLSDFQVLNSCRTKLPFQMKKFHEVKESLRMEYRYIDLRTERMQHNLRLRSATTMKIREFLCNKHDFVDVETPVLFRRTPGGAKEFIVPTHTPGKFYSLPQSPQQFKQLLMAGGLDRYFQIAKCFRDEGAKPDRQPEFTQVDLEMSFVDMDGILSLTEDMLAASSPDSKQQKLCTPFPRMSHHQALKCFGSDKPDTRFGMELNDVSHILQDSGIDFLNTVLSTPLGSVQTIVLKQGMKYLTSRDLRKVKDLGNENTTLAGLTIIVIKDNNQWQSPISNVLQQNLKEELTNYLGLEPGDVVLLAAGIHEHPYSLLGKLRLECANMMESNGMKLRDTEAFNFLWIVDFPLFLPKEDGDGLESAHHPFTAPMPEDVELLYTDPLKVKGQHYDLVLNGHEIGGGSIRIHTAKEQLYILEQILKEDSSQLQHLLHALDSGCPPHGGIALGLDRLLAILCGEPSIRDVIAFPKSHDGKDPMSKAPATVSAEDQNYYHISSKFAD